MNSLTIPACFKQWSKVASEHSACRLCNKSCTSSSDTVAVEAAALFLLHASGAGGFVIICIHRVGVGSWGADVVCLFYSV